MSGGTESDYAYMGVRRVVYGPDRATFVPACEHCGRFVQADPTIKVSAVTECIVVPNASCKKCGRVAMLFEGYI